MCLLNLNSIRMWLGKAVAVPTLPANKNKSFYLYFIRNTTFATAVTFLSIEDVSFIPISETFVESTGVIWNTPIFTD